MGTAQTSRRGLKICCAVTTIFIVIFAVVITTLALTIFKPKNPEMSVYPRDLENITIFKLRNPEISIYPQGLENITALHLGGLAINATVNATIGMIIAINNPNYGSFKFKNTTGFVSYRGEVVAEVPIQESLVSAHGKLNISTSADFMVDRLVLNATFWADIIAGSVNFTTDSTVHGKVTLLKILKLHASVPSTCDISIFIKKSKSVVSTCKTKIKL